MTLLVTENVVLVTHGHVFTAQIPEEMDKLERLDNSGDLFFFSF